MASTYTPDLRLNLQGIGDNNNTWGTVVNTQLELLDNAISGMVTVNVTTGVDQTLSTANGTADEARMMIINISGTPIANINIIVPAVTKVYQVIANNLAGSFTVTVKPTAGTGVTFSSGECGVIVCDGTNMVEISKKSDPTPAGTVVMFSGSIAAALAAYPGYGFMNGTGGTPDMRDKFPINARQDDSGVAKTNITGSLTQTGGSTTTSSNGGESLTSGSTVLTTNELPTLSSSSSTVLTGDVDGTPVNFGGGTRTLFQKVIQFLGGGAGHTHSVTTNNHTHTNVQPYYALVFLVKL